MYEIKKAQELDDPTFKLRVVDFGNGVYRLIPLTGQDDHEIMLHNGIVWSYALSDFLARNQGHKITASFATDCGLVIVTEMAPDKSRFR